jgi:hypothetical protein
MSGFDLERYDRLVARSPQGTLFCTSWWLDAVAPNSYRILGVERGGEMSAAWPIVLRSARWGGQTVTMPPLTPWLGILFANQTDAKPATQLARQKDDTEGLVSQLPEFGDLDVKFHRNFTYWLPLFWENFTQTTRYTYVLDDLSDPGRLWDGFQENIRRSVRRACKERVNVDSIDDIEAFWRVHAMTFARQGMPVPYTIDLVARLDAICRARGARKILAARGRDGEIHAVAYIVWDNRSAYYLMGGGDPEKRHSGAGSLILWEAIQFAATVSNAFDFEGSMIEPVERFFRGFGARPQPYFRITKVRSPLWLAYQSMREAYRVARNALRK